MSAEQRPDFSDEPTGRTTRLAMLEIRAEAGEKANQEVIGVQSTLQKLKWLVATALTVGVFINVGIWMNDKWQHMATKDKVDAQAAQIELLSKWKEQKDEHERSRDETITRMARQIDGLYEHLMRERGR